MKTFTRKHGPLPNAPISTKNNQVVVGTFMSYTFMNPSFAYNVESIKQSSIVK